MKLTSCLNIITSIAIHRFFKNHNSKLDNYIHSGPINLRQFRSSTELGEFQLGYCVGRLLTVFSKPIDNPNDNSEVRSKFWQLVKEHSLEFDDRVKNDLQ